MKEIKKTGYEWSLEANHRLIEVSHYELKCENTGYNVDDYYTLPVSKFDYMEALEHCEIKENSTPRKTENYLEWRMYGLVPYNISSIQSGIQFGHSCIEFSQNILGLGKFEDYYNKWARCDKTFIILNGGTTNEDKSGKFYGTMQQYRDLLSSEGILISTFYEPDLNNALTGICFLVDERVWNRTLYPDYVNIPYPWNGKRGYKPSDREMERWEKDNEKNKKRWIDKIGGPKNEFLRNFLKDKKLAN